MNRVYSQFLQGLPKPREFRPSRPDPEGLFRAGLERLATLTLDASIAGRDPSNTLSLCCFSPEVIEQNTAMFAEYAKGESEAFHALDEDGRPIRK